MDYFLTSLPSAAFSLKSGCSGYELRDKTYSADTHTQSVIFTHKIVNNFVDVKSFLSLFIPHLNSHNN